MTRRPHAKTRTGCLPCKRRHVKCAPSAGGSACANCTRRRETCEHIDTILHGGHDNTSSKTRYTVVRCRPRPPPPRTCEHDVQARFMATWHRQVGLTLALDEASPQRARLWIHGVPAMAVRHPFLAHAMFAAAAAFEACEDAHDMSLSAIARQHHRRGSLLFQSTLSDTASLLEAKIIYLLLNVVLCLALAQRTDDPFHNIATLADWLLLLRNSIDLAAKLYKQHPSSRHSSDKNSNNSNDSHISALLLPPTDTPQTLHPLDEHLAASLDSLAQHNHNHHLSLSPSTPPSPPPNHQPTTSPQTITTTIPLLLLWTRLIGIQNPSTASFIPRGTIDVFSNDLHRLIKMRDPAALVLLAHFLVPMARMRPRRWFWGNWFDQTIRDIVRVVGEDWRGDLVWVLKYVSIIHDGVEC